MGVYNTAKEVAKDGSVFIRDWKAIIKIVRLLRIVSITIIIILLIVQYWNILQYISLPAAPLFGQSLREFLHKHTCLLLVSLIIYDIFLSYILTYGIIYLGHSIKKDLMPLRNTIGNIFEIVASTIVMLYFINLLIEFWNGLFELDIINNRVIIIYLTWVILGVIRWIYAISSNYPYSRQKEYTLFFDCNGTRIAKDDMIVYKKKLYKLYEEKNINKLDYWLIEAKSGIINRVMLLDEAVKDENGKITIYKHGMEEEG